MIDKLIDIFLDALIDSAKILPFLFGVFLLMEYIEHHASHKLSEKLQHMGAFGAVGGGILGAVPQCGFSVVAANLYAGRLISVGTLIAVFISTSDEAVPMLLSDPDSAGQLWKFILVKAVIAAFVGIITDLVLRFTGRNKQEEPFRELCAHCDCEHHSLLYSALRHTGEIILFIFIVNLILGCAIEFAGEELLERILMTDSVFQPFAAALFGFIPNCAASVVITQFYIQGIVSFGSAVAGLSTGAGVGLLVLFRTNRHLKQNLAIMGVLYVSAVLSGLAINALGI